MAEFLIERNAVTSLLEVMADENEAVRRADESDLDYRRRTALANAARTILRNVEAIPTSDAGRRQGFEEGLQFAAKRAGTHAHHAHWQGLLAYGWDDETEAFGRGLAVRIAKSMTEGIHADWILHNKLLAAKAEIDNARE